MSKRVCEFEVYKNSYRNTLGIYQIVIKLPYRIQFSIGDQIQRSSLSVTANITEGYSRKNYPKDFIRFLDIARGSNDETILHLKLLRDLGYIKEDVFQEYDNQLIFVGKQLTNFIKKIRSNLSSLSSKSSQSRRKSS